MSIENIRREVNELFSIALESYKSYTPMGIGNFWSGSKLSLSFRTS